MGKLFRFRGMAELAATVLVPLGNPVSICLGVPGESLKVRGMANHGALREGILLHGLHKQKMCPVRCTGSSRQCTKRMETLIGEAEI